jgi:two-component system cell cycle sensor histidine kinase/response regulator CckA
MPASLWSRVAGVLGASVAAVGLAHLVGWGARWALLLNPPAGFIPMAPNTAAAFSLLGAALAWFAVAPAAAPSRTALRAAAVAVALLAMATLAAPVAGAPNVIDRLLFGIDRSFGAVPLAVMSPVTAVGFLVAAAAAAACGSASRSAAAWTGALGLATACLGAVVVLGYALGSPLLYGTGTIPVALTTAVAFVILGVAFLASAGPAAPPLSAMVGGSPAARMLRAFLPASVVLVLAIELIEARLITGEGANRALITGYLILAAVGLLVLIVGRLAGRIGATLDRAAAERAEAVGRADSLMRQNAMLLEAAAEGVIALDGEGRITFANPAAGRLTSWDPGDLAGRSFHETLQHSRTDGRPLASTESAILAALRTGSGTYLRRDTFCTRAGGSLPVEARVSPLAGGGLVITFNDVSERIALEEQFLQAQKMEAIGRLAGGVAHDFNNILTAMRASADLAAAALPPDSPAQDELRDLRETIERATDLTMKLLAFSRRRGDERQVNDAAATVRAVSPLLRRVLPASIELRVVATALELPVRLTANVLEQALLNLVVNSRDAMPSGGTVTIETAKLADRALGECVAIRVADTGTGMDEATKQRIFEPFFTTKPEGIGTGLGLAMVNSIVQQAGGRVEVTTGSGTGTTFELLLPLAIHKASSATVLLVEDESALRTAITRILESRGFRVLAAGDGEEAIRTANTFPGPIDLVLTDTFLPRTPFSEVADRIRVARPEARLIRMSGYPAEMREALGVAHADTPFLAKPFSPEQLVELIRKVLEEPPRA